MEWDDTPIDPAKMMVEKHMFHNSPQNMVEI